MQGRLVHRVYRAAELAEILGKTKYLNKDFVRSYAQSLKE
jgi:hypothetical protein